MANKMSIDISLNAKAYNDGIKDIKKSTEEYNNQVKNVKDNLPSLSKQLAQTRKEAKNLALAVANLSKEQRNTAEGRKMIKMLQDAQKEYARLIDINMDAQAAAKRMASDTFGLDVLKDTINGVGNAFSALTGIIGTVTNNEEKMKKAVAGVATTMATVNSVTAIANILQKESSVMIGISTLQEKLKTKAIELDTVAQGKNIIVTKAATVAQAAFNTVAEMNPYVLLAAAIAALTITVVAFTSATDDNTEKLEEQKKKIKEAEESAKNYASTVGSEFANLIGQFKKLKTQWDNLDTKQKEKQAQDYARKLGELGIEVKNLNDVESIFKSKEDEVCRSFIKRARAAASYNEMVSSMTKRMDLEQSLDLTSTYEEVELTAKKFDEFPEQLQKALIKAGAVVDKTVRHNGISAGGYVTGFDTREFEFDYKKLGKLNKAQIRTFGYQIFKEEFEGYKEAEKKYEQIYKNNYTEPFANDWGNSTTNKPEKKTEVKTTAKVDQIKIDTKAIEEDENIRKQVQNILNDLFYANDDHKVEYDFSGLDDATQKEVDGLLKQYNRLNDARNELFNLREKTNTLEQYDFVTEAIYAQADAWELAKQKLDEYNEAAKQNRENAELQAKMNEQLNLGLNALNDIGQVFSNLGNTLGQEELNVMGTIGQAIANIALSFSEGLKKESKWGVWNWIAAGAAGLIQMTSMINTIKSQTKGYAGGGVIEGPLQYGDRMLARVNAGEMILNKRQQTHLFDMIDEGKFNGSATRIYGSVTVRGDDLDIALTNHNNINKRAR